jgi:hypothetical protein
VPGPHRDRGRSAKGLFAGDVVEDPVARFHLGGLFVVSGLHALDLEAMLAGLLEILW